MAAVKKEVESKKRGRKWFMGAAAAISVAHTRSHGSDTAQRSE